MAEETSDESTYIFDSESAAEMARLIDQDRFITKAQGGSLAGLADPVVLRNIVDLGCGPGGWALDVAFALPEAQVEGFDISRIMVDYANARARTQQLLNVSFGIMNIAQPLDLPDAAFDLVNARFLGGVLVRTAWPQFIAECMRILRPGGIVRLTEGIDLGVTTSAALERLNAIGYQALWRAGYGFSHDGSGGPYMTPALPRLLREAGYQDVRHFAFALEVSAGQEAWADFYHNVEIAAKQFQPFVSELGLATREELERLYRLALAEMWKPDFCGMWHFMTFLGKKP